MNELKAEISKRTGIPVDLLVGDTPETLVANARRWLALQGVEDDVLAGVLYPQVNDSAALNPPAAGSTRERFAQWMNETFW